MCAALAKQLGWAAPSCSLKEQLTSRVGKRKIFINTAIYLEKEKIAIDEFVAIMVSCENFIVRKC